MSNSAHPEGSNNRWKPPFMPWFEGDFAGSFNVRKMAPLARLMYRSLLQQSWHSDYPPYLPNDDSLLRLMADAPSAKTWNKHRDEILSRFQKSEDERWLFHPKSLREYDRAVADHARKVAGGLHRWQGEQKQSTSSPSGEHVQVDTAPVSSQNHIYDQNEPTTTSRTRPTSTSDSESLLRETAIEARESQGDSDDQNGGLIGQICRIHPRMQKVPLTQQYIMEAARKEIARGASAVEALDYLLDRTRRYRQITDGWPADQRQYILSSAEFFRTESYRDDPKLWEKRDDGPRNKAQQQQGSNRAAIVEALGYRSGTESRPSGDHHETTTLKGGGGILDGTSHALSGGDD